MILLIGKQEDYKHLSQPSPIIDMPNTVNHLNHYDKTGTLYSYKVPG